MDHCSQINLLCRVCGGRLLKAKDSKKACRKYNCTDLKNELETAFNIDISNDRVDIAPTHMCRHCYAIMQQCISAHKNQRTYKHSIRVVNWITESCNTVSKVY